MGGRVGDVLASKYKLEELLGTGGMGHVYRATNARAGRQVAIKVLRPEHAQDQGIVDRFLREAMAANRVRHPNVVDVLDVDKDEDGTPFIVQELLTGEDLSKYIRRRGGKLRVEEIEAYYLPVVDASRRHMRTGSCTGTSSRRTSSSPTRGIAACRSSSTSGSRRCASRT